MFALTPRKFVSIYDKFSEEGRFCIDTNIRKEESYRVFQEKFVLFNPATLYPVFNPVTISLEKALDSIDINKYKTIIIPICESSSFLDLKRSNHMITLVIDNDKKKIYLLDSRSFTIPSLAKTDIIHEIVNIYLSYPFERVYLKHQSIFDVHSCCYFSIMNIFFLLKYKGNMRIFFSFLPEPNTLLGTSDNFLRDEYINEIIDHIYEKCYI